VKKRKFAGENAELNQVLIQIHSTTKQSLTAKYTKYAKQSLEEATDGSPRLQPWDFNANGHKPRRGGRNVASNLPHPILVPEIIANDLP
jgi:hypothetical protein